MEHPVSAILLIAGSLNVVAGYHVVESTMSWADASAYCSDTYGSTLATFSTDAEASELRTLMDASSKGNFWFGLNDLASEGTWVFESGYDCGGNCDSIEEWNSGEPNDSGSNEDCAHFWPSGTTFKINDLLCSYDALAFICDDADTTTSYSYIGCYADTGNRALDDYLGTMTIEACHEASVANGYTYFGVQAGGQCFCGNSLSEATQYGTASNCVSGTGGSWANSLYRNTGTEFETDGTLSPSVVPSSAPSPAPSTANPTAIPTAIPSVEPTTDPTAVPTVEPTSVPTRCDIDAIYGVNWHDMLNDDGSNTLLQGSDITFDANTLSLTFSASLEYVGLSADGNFDDDYNLGTTYWIDFQSFSESADGVDAAGTCANREAEDYANLTFAEWWEYTADPLDLANAANAERMAYPDSNWTLDAASGTSCNVVEYERTFSWTDMKACDDAEGNGLIQVTQTTESITLSGTFFVELVSPYSMSSADYYRAYPVLQQDFAIVLDRQVDAFASTGVQLFISTVMAYGRDDDGNYELTILVQSADYVMLGMDNAVTAITSPLEVSDIETVSDCLVASSFTCGQIFTATIPAANCSADDNTFDLSGTYQFGFTPECQTLDDGSNEPACDVFLTTLDDSAGKVVLDVDASFTDNCDVDLFSVTFDANLTFYEDDAFTVPVNDDNAFVIGQDTIYGKVLVDIPDDNEDGEMYDFVQVSIENVYVCTADADRDLSLNASSGLGGCLSEHIDADGPYVVYGSGAETKYLGETYPASGNEATFSFLTFDTPRTTINVHVQLLLTLETDTGVRRRMLLEADLEEGNAFQSFIGTASVQEGETTAEPVGTDGAAKLSGGFIAAMLAFTAYILG